MSINNSNKINKMNKETVKITIDNTPLDVKQGYTILKAAVSLGKAIPTMCHSSGNKKQEEMDELHSSSCSLCLVENTKTGELLPACGTRIYETISIRTESEAITEARRKSLELLMSEHLGDCLAPCVLPCPSGLDIPLLLKQLYANNDKETLLLLDSYSNKETFPCISCPGPCEKVCRRAQIDTALPIKRFFVQAYNMYKKRLKNKDMKQNIQNEKFTSVIGRLQDDIEKQLVLKHSLENRTPAKQILYSEAGKCLQCGCIQKKNCSLRDYSEEYKVKRASFKTGKRCTLKPIVFRGALQIETGKCLLCKRCVNLSKVFNLEPSPLIWYRGYKSEIRFSESRADNETAKRYEAECPAGALSYIPHSTKENK